MGEPVPNDMSIGELSLPFTGYAHLGGPGELALVALVRESQSGPLRAATGELFQPLIPYLGKMRELVG